MEPTVDEMLELGYKFGYCEPCNSVYFTCPKCGGFNCSVGRNCKNPQCDDCVEIYEQFSRTELFNLKNSDHFRWLLGSNFDKNPHG